MYSIRPMIKLLLLLLPAVGGLLFAYNVLRQKQTMHIKEGIRRCIRVFPFVLTAAILSGAACFGYLRAGEPYAGSFKMSYTYPKASKGLTPNSTTLDVSEIFSEEVLENAVLTGRLGSLTPDEVKDTLSVQQVKQRGGVSVDALYVSTEYVVSYNASSRTAAQDKNVLMKTVADSYYEYFLSKYGRKTKMLENDALDLTGLDYLDIGSYLQRRISAVIAYMNMCQEENATFVSEATNESFASVRDKARNFQNVSLERYKAYVLKYGLSRDREQYISRLNYENRLTHVNYMKNLAAYSVRLAAIARYEGDITRAVLVPTRDETGEFYQSRTKIGTDYFADEADAHLKYATKNQLDIETNNYYIECLSRAAGDSVNQQKADEMVESLKKELALISHQAVETVKDYDAQTSNGYISFVFQEGGTWSGFGLKKTALYVAGFVGIWLAAAFTSTELPKRRLSADKK